ncbi:MAG: hypothetical protein K6D02_02605 [Lachnospiraceae bacterium]|nr:hypothetical protein [Lachnospiraceae bacterium]
MKDKIKEFMRGRYGADHLSNFIMVFACVFMVLGILIRVDVVRLILFVIAVVALVFSYVRIFSKNHVKRYNENQKYLEIKDKVIYKIKNSKFVTKDRTVKIYKCPGCGVKVRVPKGKGKILITCPKCHTEFVKKT